MTRARRRMMAAATIVAWLSAIACSTATKSSNVRVPAQPEAAASSPPLTEAQRLKKTELAIRREGRWLDGVDASTGNVFSGGETRGTISEIRGDVLVGKFSPELVGRTLRPQFASLLSCYENARIDDPMLPPAAATVRLSFGASGAPFSAEVRA